MSIVELFLIAIGVSMDAFAVSVCKGLGMTKLNKKNAFCIALFFGGFQALMPLIGWFVGSRFQHSIENFDHWIAFGLLVFIGGQMVYESFHKEDDAEENTDALNIGQLFLMAIATSIDALAIGVTFALLPGVDIFTSITLIGITTLVISYIGVLIGFRFGNRYEKKAQMIGGIILILIGCKILLEHLDILVFS